MELGKKTPTMIFMNTKKTKDRENEKEGEI
jgi:hypothetical protein